MKKKTNRVASGRHTLFDMMEEDVEKHVANIFDDETSNIKLENILKYKMKYVCSKGEGYIDLRDMTGFKGNMGTLSMSVDDNENLREGLKKLVEKHFKKLIENPVYERFNSIMVSIECEDSSFSRVTMTKAYTTKSTVSYYEEGDDEGTEPLYSNGMMINKM